MKYNVIRENWLDYYIPIARVTVVEGFDQAKEEAKRFITDHVKGFKKAYDSSFEGIKYKFSNGKKEGKEYDYAVSGIREILKGNFDLKIEEKDYVDLIDEDRVAIVYENKIILGDSIIDVRTNFHDMTNEKETYYYKLTLLMGETIEDYHCGYIASVIIAPIKE